MKALIVFMALTIAITSCTKEKNSLKTISDKFVGDWIIWEVVSSVPYNSSAIFNSTIFKVNDSTFGLVESNRTPIPNWIYKPNLYDYKTIHFQVDEVNKEIFSTKPFCRGTYSVNMDTIQFTFDLPYYYVRQTVIRQ